MAIKPARGLVLCRKAETEETLPGGRIVLLDAAREEMTHAQMEVVEAGEPEICEDEDCEQWHLWTEEWSAHLSDAKPGDWILIRPRSYLPTDDDTLFLVKQSDVLGVFCYD